MVPRIFKEGHAVFIYIQNLSIRCVETCMKDYLSKTEIYFPPYVMQNL